MSAAIDNNFFIKNKDYDLLLEKYFPELVWVVIDVNGKKRNIPDKKGVYFCCLTDKKTGHSDVYYVGSTTSIRNRMYSNLHIINACKNLTSFDVLVKFSECEPIRAYEKDLHRRLNPIIVDGVFSIKRETVEGVISENGLID